MDHLAHSLTCLVVAVVALVLGACAAPPDNDGSDCDCPNLESVATGIDWLGDGSVADVVESGAGAGDTLKLSLRYNVADRHVALQSAKERVSRIGLAVAEDDVEFMVLAGDRWELGIAAGGNDVVKQLFVTVLIADDDEHTVDILQPAVDALGMIP